MFPSLPPHRSGICHLRLFENYHFTGERETDAAAEPRRGNERASERAGFRGEVLPSAFYASGVLVFLASAGSVKRLRGTAAEGGSGETEAELQEF